MVTNKHRTNGSKLSDLEAQLNGALPEAKLDLVTENTPQERVSKSTLYKRHFQHELAKLNKVVSAEITSLGIKDLVDFKPIKVSTRLEQLPSFEKFKRPDGTLRLSSKAYGKAARGDDPNEKVRAAAAQKVITAYNLMYQSLTGLIPRNPRIVKDFLTSNQMSVNEDATNLQSNLDEPVEKRRTAVLTQHPNVICATWVWMQLQEYAVNTQNQILDHRNSAKLQSSNETGSIRGVFKLLVEKEFVEDKAAERQNGTTVEDYHNDFIDAFLSASLSAVGTPTAFDTWKAVDIDGQGPDKVDAEMIKRCMYYQISKTVEVQYLKGLNFDALTEFTESHRSIEDHTDFVREIKDRLEVTRDRGLGSTDGYSDKSHLEK